MKALLHFSASSRLRSRLAAIADPLITIVAETDDEAFRREIADTEVLLHCLKPVTAEVIASAPRLRLIQKIGVGVNTIDLEAARRAGIAVANMPGTNTTAVAEHTLALMLATLRRVTFFHQAMRQGNGWRLPADDIEAFGELRGSTVGFIGYGAVPQQLTPALHALGADIRYWNRSPRTAPLATAMPLDELIRTADILSLHVPLTETTHHMLNHDALQSMKPGAILINTARGQLIDQHALSEALLTGKLAGAGLDVFEDEPILDRDPFAACPTVVLTPHIAWLTPATLERSLAVILENMQRLADNRPLLHCIVPPRSNVTHAP